MQIASYLKIDNSLSINHNQDIFSRKDAKTQRESFFIFLKYKTSAVPRENILDYHSGLFLARLR
jgi:hypothetical protein